MFLIFLKIKLLYALKKLFDEKIQIDLLFSKTLSVFKEVPFYLDTVQKLTLHWKLLKFALSKIIQ